MSNCPRKDGRALSLEKGVPLARVKGRIDHFPADSKGQSAGHYSYARVSVIIICDVNADMSQRLAGCSMPWLG